MNVMTKRGISILMALCMVLSLVALPGAPVAKAAVADLISTPIYENSMDSAEEWKKINYPSPTFPTDVHGNKYLNFKLDANSKSDAYYSGYAKESGIYTNVVLKYDFMLDNSEDAESWTVYLPAFANRENGRLLGQLNVTQEMKLSETQLTAGTWYTLELVAKEGKIDIYLNGQRILNNATIYKYDASTDTNTLKMVHMGIAKGSATAISMNIDNLAIYSYVAGTEFAATAASYDVNVGATVDTAWTKTEGAYLSSVTFTSSDPDVATVDENGVVTGVSGGTVTITATPNTASGMSAATTTVTVKDSNVAEAIYYHSMDDVNEDSTESTKPGNVSGTHDAHLPLGWTHRVNNALSSSVKTDNGKTYWQMKTNEAKGGNAWTYYQYCTDGTKNVALSYDVMTDCTDESYTVRLPAFGATMGNRTVELKIVDDYLTFDNTTMKLEKGQWYHIDLVCLETTVQVYVDGVSFAEEINHYGLSKASSINYIIMGLGADSVPTTTLTMNIDELSVYDLTDVAAMANGTYYKNAAAAATEGGYMTLYADADAITVPTGKTLHLDLNGHNVATLNAEGTVYGSDSSTKDHTNENYGKITTVTGSGLQGIHTAGTDIAKTGYVTDGTDSNVSFHHFEVKIASVTLRAEEAGIGYKLYMAGNAKVQSLLNSTDAYGVTVYVFGNEDGGKSAHAGADTFAVGEKLVMIKNIFATTNEAATNATYGEKKVCVNGYIQFGDEKVQVSYTAGKSMKDVLTLANTNFASYDETQQAGLVSFYNNYINGNDAFSGWQLGNIAEAATAAQN